MKEDIGDMKHDIARIDVTLDEVLSIVRDIKGKNDDATAAAAATTSD